MIPSTFENEGELLRAVIKLHCPHGIELDPMYSKGHFYIERNEVRQPQYKFDKNPQTDETEQADARDLPLSESTIKTMILDPPFCFGVHGKTKQNISAKRFTMFESFSQLESLYRGILTEAKRVLQKKGILIFKCQDYTDSKTTMTHCFVWQWALELGFYAKDLAILENKSRIYNPHLRQRHLRKTHTYFWIFQNK